MRMQHFPLMKIRKRSISNVYELFSLGEYLWGYSAQKTQQGRAANIGSKISLLVYQWPLYYAKFGIFGTINE